MTEIENTGDKKWKDQTTRFNTEQMEFQKQQEKQQQQNLKKANH